MKQTDNGKFTTYTADNGKVLVQNGIYFQSIRWFKAFGTPDIEEVPESEMPQPETETVQHGEVSDIEDLRQRVEELERRLAEKEEKCS